MAYSGKYIPNNHDKYSGKIGDIVFRSLWELQTFKWCDKNNSIKKWGSETVIIPYYDPTAKRNRRYFIDLYIEFVNGEKIIVEIKPKKQTLPPKTPKRKTRRYIRESMTYVRNCCKWEAAEKYATKRGWKFHIWNESDLRNLGMIIL